MNLIIWLGLIFGLTGWVVVGWFIYISLKDKEERWIAHISFNDYHEGIIEVIAILSLIVFEIIALVIYAS